MDLLIVPSEPAHDGAQAVVPGREDVPSAAADSSPHEPSPGHPTAASPSVAPAANSPLLVELLLLDMELPKV